MSEDLLLEARETINGIDRDMARLFERRMETVRRISEYKRAHGLPAYDAAREQAIIQRNSALIADPLLRDEYVQFIHAVMDLSKQYQYRLAEAENETESGRHSGRG